MSKSHLVSVSLRRLDHHHIMILSSATLGTTILLCAGLDWAFHREMAALMIAAASVFKEVMDVIRHFVDVFEAASVAHDVVEGAQVVSNISEDT